MICKTFLILCRYCDKAKQVLKYAVYFHIKNKEKLMSKIAVLGGGLSGRLIAFQLAEQGVAVEVV